jgi:hypothetical protein
MFKDVEKYSFLKTPLETPSATPNAVPIRKVSDKINSNL